MQCTAKSKRSGKQCKKSSVVGRKVCHIHGGKSLSGLASPTLKTGEYMKYLPTSLGERFRDAKNDVELKNIDNLIALLDMQLFGLLEEMDIGDFGSHYTNIAKRYYATMSLLNKFKRTKNKNEEIFIELEDNLADLGQLIETGQLHFQNRQEIRTVASDKIKAIKTQSDIQHQSDNAVTIKELNNFMVLLLNVILGANLETDKLKYISDGITRMWNIEAKELEDG